MRRSPGGSGRAATGLVVDTRDEDLIQRLLARGHAYVGRDGAIWFNVASLEDYGPLARQAGQDMDSAASKLNLTIDDESTAKALA